MAAFNTKLVGVTKPAPDGTDRQRIIAKFVSEGMILELKPEPENKYDKNAIGVWIHVKGFFSNKRFHIGYISAEIADRLSGEIQGGKEVKAKVKNVTGGSGRALGVNISIDA